jgi:hypothetical protein
MLRGLDRRQVADGVAAAVAQDLPPAFASGQPVLVGALDAFLPEIVDIGEADHVRGDFARRVVAAEFAPQMQPGHAHGGDPDRLLRRHRAPHAEFAARLARQRFRQVLRRHAEHPGQLGMLGGDSLSSSGAPTAIRPAC